MNSINKVSKAVFPPIPKLYSKKLSKIISSLLKKKPDLRPTAEEILKNILLKQNLDRYVPKHTLQTEYNDNLLDTIRFPNNFKLKQIINKLPKANYG